MTDADETHTFPVNLPHLATPRRQLRVVYCENTWSSTGKDLNICAEADTTRWWLLDKGLWLDDKLIRRADVIDDEADVRSIAAYPILDYPDRPVEQQDVSFYLGCDAEIYIYDEDADRFSPFTPDDPFVGHDVTYLIKKLSMMRAE